ncbi:MAG: OFA family MFS transporter [Desulfobulbaceae bacterium]|jgi:OFA family oxalate/formate antiporter-like MFS transporter|nr:OFA family MFS transporter [Desulfobulbaceae bacterium]
MQLEEKRWLYLVVGAVMNAIIGQTYAWSVFAKPLAERFDWSLADTSVAFAIFHSISCLPIIIAGKLQEFVQPKIIILFGAVVFGLGILGVGFIDNLTFLYLTYGVMGGIGMGTIYSGVVPNIVKFFPDRRGLASGVLAAGIGFGALIWGPIGAALIERYGVSPAFTILGVLSLVSLCVLAMLIQTAPDGFIPAGWTPSASQRQNLTALDKNWRGMLADPLYYCIAAVIVLGAISGLMIIAQASPILQAVGGYSAIAAGTWVGVLAVCNSCGRAGWGWISDRIGRMPSLVIIYAILGCAMFWLSATDWLVVAPILLVGMCFGGFMGMLASLTADAFGVKYLAMNFGIMFLPFAVAAFIGPRLGASIKETSGSYSQAFLYGAILAFIAIVLALVAAFMMRRRRRISG